MTIPQKYNQFFQEHHKEPLYAEADVCWLDTGEICSGYIIKLSSDCDEKEDSLIFYCVDSLAKLQSLTQPGDEDFIILENSVEFLENTN